MRPWTVVGVDGRERCAWAEHRELRHYHDTEWGHPVRGDAAMFERLTLEAFQSGLSWLVILRKRAALRQAFAQFQPAVVADFDERDIARLMTDPSIIRNRAKITATIANARIVSEFDGGFADFLWTFRPLDAQRPTAAEPDTSPESHVMAAALKTRGIRFVGPVTSFALMKATGMVNAHHVDCEFGEIFASG